MSSHNLFQSELLLVVGFRFRLSPGEGGTLPRFTSGSGVSVLWGVSCTSGSGVSVAWRVGSAGALAAASALPVSGSEASSEGDGGLVFAQINGLLLFSSRYLLHSANEERPPRVARFQTILGHNRENSSKCTTHSFAYNNRECHSHPSKASMDVS